jgi:hypothetical protein
MAKRRSREEWRAVVRAWRKSGQSQTAFAASRGMAPRTLSWWVWKLKQEVDEELDPAVFVPVEVEAERERGAPTDRAVAVVEHGSASILIGGNADPGWVAKLVRELASC